jgi:hypothetical protein
MSLEAAIAELQLDRQIQKNRLAALERERNRTSSPFKQETLNFRIRTLTQHLFDIDTVLDAMPVSRHQRL